MTFYQLNPDECYVVTCPGCDSDYYPWDDHECVMTPSLHEPDDGLIPEGALTR